MKTIKCTLGTLLTLLSFEISAQSTLATAIKENSIENPYNSLILYPGITVDYKTNFEPEIYHKILYQTNAPDQIKKVFIKVFERINYTGIDYNKLFPNQDYSEEEISQTIDTNRIDCFLKIEYASDVYNKATKAVVQPNLNGKYTAARDLLRRRVHLKIDFYSDESGNIPFYKVSGGIEGDVISEIQLVDKVFWITMKELKKRRMLL